MNAQGAEVWYDEAGATWRAPGEEPAGPQALFEVVLLEAGERPERVVRILRQEVSTPPDELRRLVSSPPAVVLHGVGYATAEVVRMALERAGATAEVREL